jgi:hypothetical protein
MAHLFGQAKSERIIFDTSALNWLADDDGADTLIGRLVERSGCGSPRLTSVNSLLRLNPNAEIAF